MKETNVFRVKADIKKVSDDINIDSTKIIKKPIRKILNVIKNSVKLRVIIRKVKNKNEFKIKRVIIKLNNLMDRILVLDSIL